MPGRHVLCMWPIRRDETLDRLFVATHTTGAGVSNEQTKGPDGIEALISAITSHHSEELAEAYSAMTDSLRDFLDALAGARLEVGQAEELRDLLQGWTPRLREQEVDEFDRPWGHIFSSPGHAQTFVPRIYDTVYRHDEFRGRTILGRFHVGENMAAHGGAVSVVFDDFLGWLMLKTGMPPSRTGYLKTNFRAITPIGVELDLVGRVERIEGRKRFLRGELYHGDTLCADAEGLWIELLPGQG